jgi:HK97 family phage major capsid protein
LTHSIYAAPAERLPWFDDIAAARRGLGSSKGLLLGALIRAIALGSETFADINETAGKMYGERHPVAEAIRKALTSGVGAGGGYIVPPDQSVELIELLRPKVAVRAAEPIVLPMPRGTMTLPAQTSPATAYYSGEHAPITASQPAFGQKVATFKKLTAMVPVANDLMRFADPAADAIVRNDLVKVIGLREDIAFLMSDGTQGSPIGMTSFANLFARQNGGTPAVWLSTGPSTAGVGGNFVTSATSFTLSSAVAELAGLISNLAVANVPEDRRAFFMNPRSFWYLATVTNSLGVQFFPRLASTKKIWDIPVFTSTNIPIDLIDSTGAYTDCSFVILAEMTEALLFDSMALEIEVSPDATYVDSSGNTQSAFANDETVIRAIAEHDFTMRHPASLAVAQFVRWQGTV